MCTLDPSFLKKTRDMEAKIKEHEKVIKQCLDLIEGIHVIIDEQTGTNLVSTTPPVHLRGKSRKRKKSHKKKKSSKHTPKKKYTRRR